jgi:hypothetical protein
MIKSSLRLTHTRLTLPRLTLCALIIFTPVPGVYAAPKVSAEDRIDESFSNIGAGLSEEEARKLKNVTITRDNSDTMTVVDSNGVEHDFYDGLWQKMLHVKPGVPLKPIKALGIGMARDKKSALDAVRKFTGKKKFECDTDKPAEKEELAKFGSYQFCSQRTAGEGGYIWVEFDKKDQLTRAGYQVWDPF